MATNLFVESGYLWVTEMNVVNAENLMCQLRFTGGERMPDVAFVTRRG